MNKYLLGLCLVGISVAWQPAWGFGSYPDTLCDTYPSSPHCASAVSCQFCHTTGNGGPRNQFGTCLQNAGAASNLPDALAAVEAEDCDQDGAANLDEILAGTFPGTPDQSTGGGAAQCEQEALVGEYTTCGYDPDYVYRKVQRDFCGESPSYADFRAFKGLEDDDLKKRRLHELLDECLQSAFWRGKDGVVWRLAYPKVTPISVIKTGPNGGSIPLADYDDDLNLYAYHQLDDNDLRGVMLADYFVDRNESTGRYLVVGNLPAHTENPGVPEITAVIRGNDARQFVNPPERAGILTTSYSFASKTMFTSVTRGIAAHYLKVFLGIDVAQGILPPIPAADQSIVEGLFADHDSKNVDQANGPVNCYACHIALDPVAYPFSKYNGFSFGFDPTALADLVETYDGEGKLLLRIIASFLQNGGGGGDNDSGSRGGDRGGSGGEQFGSIGGGGSGITLGGLAGNNILDSIPLQLREALVNSGALLLPYHFVEQRAEILAPSLASTEPNLKNLPKQGYFNGQMIDNVRDFAIVATEMEEFYQRVVLDYWGYIFRSKPAAEHREEFEALWRNLKNKGDQTSFVGMEPQSGSLTPNPGAPTAKAMLHELIDTEAYGVP